MAAYKYAMLYLHCCILYLTYCVIKWLHKTVFIFYCVYFHPEPDFLNNYGHKEMSIEEACESKKYHFLFFSLTLRIWFVLFSFAFFGPLTSLPFAEKVIPDLIRYVSTPTA